MGLRIDRPIAGCANKAPIPHTAPHSGISRQSLLDLFADLFASLSGSLILPIGGFVESRGESPIPDFNPAVSNKILIGEESNALGGGVVRSRVKSAVWESTCRNAGPRNSGKMPQGLKKLRIRGISSNSWRFTS